MDAPVVWFNQHFSNTWQSWRHLRRLRGPNEFHLLGSHSNRHHLGARHCDTFVVEPSGVSDDDYVRFCLDLAHRYRVRLLFPWRRVPALLDAETEFHSVGTTLVTVANKSTFSELLSKTYQYARSGGDVPVPDHVVVNDAAGFEKAYETLRQTHPILCYKPAESIFAWGFKVVVEHETDRRKVPVSDTFVIGYTEARRALRETEPFADLIVMPYLPGPERSVDCLAHRGELIRAIVRRISDQIATEQFIEVNPRVQMLAQTLTRTWNLHGVFNVQFRDADGEPYLLEINPRMAGGIPFTADTGCFLPYWAVRLALGTVTAAEIPQPKTEMTIRTDGDVSSF